MEPDAFRDAGFRLEVAEARGGEGFSLWCAPGWPKPEPAIHSRDAVPAAGANGLLMTTWSPLKQSNRAALLTGVCRMGPIHRGEE